MPSHCNVRSCRELLKQLLLPCFSFRFTKYSSSKSMSSATLDSTTAAASENGTGSLPQSTAVETIDASGPATEQSEEGRPPQIPIIQVAFKNEMWWSIPPDVSAYLFALFAAGQDAVFTWNWGESRLGSWSPDGQNTNINRYMIYFERKLQKNLDNGRLRTIRVIWIDKEDATPEWNGQIPDSAAEDATPDAEDATPEMDSRMDRSDCR